MGIGEERKRRDKERKDGAQERGVRGVRGGFE
jgi:hypothetical protein